MHYFLIFIFSFLLPFFSPSLLNTNKILLTSKLTLYYSFTSESKIEFKVTMKENTGWVGLGFGSTMTNTDMIRFYMNNGFPQCDDLWSTGETAPQLDLKSDVTVLEGSRDPSNLLSITCSRAVDTADTINDYKIVIDTEIPIIYAIATTDTFTKHALRSTLAIIFTKNQICDDTCTQNACTGPEPTDCSCADGFFYDAASKTCLKCMNNCGKCSIASTCTSCSNNFYYLSSSTSNSCVACTDPNQFQSAIDNKICSICDQNCISCGSDINCNICADAYYRLNRKCNPCTLQNCKTCTSSSCSACLPGFFLGGTQDACLACGTNCYSCSSNSLCTKCNANYYLQNNNCVLCTDISQLKQGNADGSGACEICVANCKTCTDKTICNTCADGYLIRQGGCDKCSVTSCKKCSPIGTCSECLNGYNLSENKCNLCSLDGCDKCDGTGKKCLTCITGYNIFNGICNVCEANNCAFCLNSDKTKCQYCNDNYYLKSDYTCDICTDNCQACWGKDVCLKCMDYHYLKNGFCYQCSILKCLTCSSNNNCTGCAPKYFLKENLCLKCIDNCELCSDKTSCQTCSSGYILNDASKKCEKCSASNCKTCSTTSKCDTCLDSYFISTSGSCDVCSASCLNCSSTSVCTKCTIGYYLDQNTCKVCSLTNCKSCSEAAKCEICENNYSLTSLKTCVSCPFNNTCASCQSDNVCSACQNGYLLNTDLKICISCKSNCLTCSSDGTCTKCNFGFYLKTEDNTCTACNENCKECSKTECISCFDGFSLNSLKACVSCNLEKCDKCELVGKCSTCSNGYSLNSVLFTCGCSDSQYLDVNTCKNCNAKINNCYSCIEPNTCLKCEDNYYLKSNACVKCPFDDKCAECTETKCLKCKFGYFMSGNNTCSTCFQDCATCLSAESNKCLSCNQNFFLSDNNECLSSICPTKYANCQYCKRDPNSFLFVCAICKDNFYLAGDTCDICHPTCLTCSGRSPNNCLSCPSYSSIFYRDSNSCGYACAIDCLTCDGITSKNCLSCKNSKVLWNKDCINVDLARNNLVNKKIDNSTVILELYPFVIGLKSFVQRTNEPKSKCIDNNDCFNNGECYLSKCTNCKYYTTGQQCQISIQDLDFAISKKTDVLLNLISQANIQAYLINVDFLYTNYKILGELTSSIEFFSTKETIFSTINLLLVLNNGTESSINVTVAESSIKCLSNMVYVLNHYNKSLISNLSRVEEKELYKNISKAIDTIVKSKQSSSLQSQGDFFQMNTPYYSVIAKYIDLSQSLTPKFTLHSSIYYDINEPYLSQLSLTADAVSLMLKINGGNSKIILKQSNWIDSNPFPEDQSKQNNLTLAAGITGIYFYKTNGDLLSITGISDAVAIRIKKTVSGINLDTTQTLQRYACAYWDESQNIWRVDDIKNNLITESINYIGCYTTHFSEFSVFYSNKTNFFALEFVENQLWYVKSNYGFIASIFILVLSCIAVPTIVFSKREMSGFTKKPKHAYKNVREMEKPLESTERNEIQLEAFQSYGENKKNNNSHNTWMLFPVYSIILSPGPAIAVQRFTIFIINIMVFLTILSFCFADYSVIELKEKAIFAAFSFAAILVSWFTNYLFGFMAWILRKKDNLNVNIVYWLIFLIVWVVLSFFTSWRMAYVDNEYGNYWLLSVAICLVFDTFLFDLFLVTIAKEVGSNPRNLERLTKFLRFRGYYD